MSEPIVEGRRLSRQFGPTSALRGLDVVVRNGESLAIFGPNGAGKTTLLKLVSGVLRPTAGTLAVFGETTPSAALRRRIGLVGHGSFLYPDLTARENLAFYAALFDVADRERRIDEMLAAVDLEPWASRPVRTFSRGMEQRLALARAFLHRPDLLLLDEPYSGLDPQAVRRLQAILSRAHADGQTIVLTTHDIERGLEVCDHAAILHHGRMVWLSGRFLPGPSEMARIYHREVDGRDGADG
jgi:heme exporter protein A